MEATYTVVAARIRVGRWTTMKSILRAVAAVFAEGARGHEFNRRFSTPSTAQFAALPRGQQNQVLDRGARPLSG